MFRAILPLFIFSILMVFLYIGLGLDPRVKESVLIDKPAPRFNLPVLERPDEMLNEQVFLGKVSLVNAWASWCISCRHEHPLLMQIKTHTDIPIYGLNYKDEADDALQVLRQQGNPYEANFFDVRGRVGMDWGIIGTPETFVVDQQGIVRYKHTGPLTIAVLETEILPLIEKLRHVSFNQSL